VVAKVRERLAISKQAAQEYEKEKFYLMKLNELEVRKEYQIKISNRFAALENLSDSEDIHTAWESIKENIKTPSKESLGLYELKQHKPWFGKECCSCLLEQRKQVKLQCIQNTNKSIVDNLNNVRSEASRLFRNKRRNI
jgi:hypothetical protein